MAQKVRGSSPSLSSIEYRRRAARTIPGEIGVYALCDLDGVPIYVGQSTEGIRQRANRHLTSARSDIIANRQIDVWEIASIRCWVVDDPEKLDPLEAHFFHEFHAESPLMNGSIPHKVSNLGFKIPEAISIQLLPDDEIRDRQRVELRLPRQAKHFGDLLDHFLTVKDSKELLLALRAHFSRLEKYFNDLHPEPSPDDVEAESEH
jgi:hypothetical protein